MTLTNTQNGLLITDIKNNQLVKQTYQGYTKAEAKKLFKEHLKTVK